jgi:serine/threonine-protein kinase SRK2
VWMAIGEKIDFEIYSQLTWHQGVFCFKVRTPSTYTLTVSFQQVILTPTHLAIVMEYASGGELFERIVDRGRFSEDEVAIYNPS